MRKPISERLSSGPLVTDGGWETEMHMRGLQPGDCHDVWILAHPDRVEAVARAYAEARSQVILIKNLPRGGNSHGAPGKDSCACA